ncbi:hypothetical protein OG801_26055 [Nocardioides sp. NBC_00163]|uniref:hypothetical protein n=1 Tax=Nocardioides sp. NBC_00163 TaxID=2975999 RepID=UPI00325679F7
MAERAQQGEFLPRTDHIPDATFFRAGHQGVIGGAQPGSVWPGYPGSATLADDSRVTQICMLVLE